ncbi:hypothetical protein QQF45_13955 [Halopseudomonas aestusnigri]|uniref:pilus assembly PilX family protein n=1 Tax=Halopseudomonas aestusnigri TaxID=857252 RepID=UPI0025538C62|nr:hypothetical protein [Halopseudomonas aestusnigri]MDL2200148.1 hypothetical protein [Halopseudomonas aestusnigri]
MSSRQSGSVLPITLICLLALTIGALAASSSARIQQQQAANLMLATRCFQAAESAMRELESELATGELEVPAQPCDGMQCSAVPSPDEDGWRRRQSAGAVDVRYRIEWVGTSRMPAQLEVSGESRVYRLQVDARLGRSRRQLEAIYAYTLR